MQSFIAKFSIGRDRQCDVPIADESVSRLHAELLVTSDGSLVLADCLSRNGTAILRQGAPRPVRQEYVLLEDEVQFGDAVLSMTDIVESLQVRHPEVYLGRDAELRQFQLAELDRAKAGLVTCECGAQKRKDQPCPGCKQ